MGLFRTIGNESDTVVVLPEFTESKEGNIMLAVNVQENEDQEYRDYLGSLSQRFAEVTRDGFDPIFTTDVTGLWEAYLGSFPLAERQYYNCNSCRHFIERFGGLVVIDAGTGLTASAFWGAQAVPLQYYPAVATILGLVKKAKVTGVFLSDESTWGTPSNISGSTGRHWDHLHLNVPGAMVYRERALTAHQAMAEKREDKKNISRALAEYSPQNVGVALQILSSDALYRSEKVKGPVEFLDDLYLARDIAKNRDNITWKMIAKAPSGFCHPRSSMVGTLLDDLGSGKSFEDTAAAFKAKMHPLSYQRLQTAPNSGTIEAAEKLVEKLGIQKSLERRFARLEEVEAFWRHPEAVSPAKDGVFGHLKGNLQNHTIVIHQTITFEKFKRTVLPDSEKLELQRPAHGSYGALLTALHDDAPPIIQWDSEEQRNPFSWYLWHGGSSCIRWGLSLDNWVKVTAICEYPANWFDGKYSHHEEASMFLLEGCRESKQSGNALFPEILKSELHGARSVVEAFSKKAHIHEMEKATACGLVISGSSGAKVRSTVGKVVTEYVIDRWD